MLDFFNAYKLILLDAGILLRARLQNLELPNISFSGGTTISPKSHNHIK